MSAALWVLIAVLIIAAVLLLAAMLTPVRLTCMMRSTPEWRLTVVARPFGGLAPPLQIHDSLRQTAGGRTKPAKREKRTGRFRRAWARVRPLIAEPHLLADLLRPIHVRRLEVDADVGLADPADTGHLYGVLTSAIHSGMILPRSSASIVSVDVRPDFSGPRLSGEALAELSFIPAAFLPPAVRFARRIHEPDS